MNKLVAIYARVSSDSQNEQHTITARQRPLIDYAQANGYMYHLTYAQFTE
jgi:DNA invertase Pin-like site-specific DNA recombinase